MIIIGLAGKAGSGKSSVAKYLEDIIPARLGMQVRRVSFATPLKKMAKDIWGFTNDQVFGDATQKETVDPRHGITPRDAMKLLGQSARHHMGSMVWIDAAMKWIEDCYNGDRRGGVTSAFVIDDVRYVNEAEVIKKGKQSSVYFRDLWRLHCPDSISNDDGKHASEAEVDLIRPSLVSAELHATRAQGLPYLFRLVDAEIELIRFRVERR